MSLGEWLLAFAKLVLLMVFNVRLCRVFQPLAPLPPPLHRSNSDCLHRAYDAPLCNTYMHRLYSCTTTAGAAAVCRLGPRPRWLL